MSVCYARFAQEEPAQRSMPGREGRVATPVSGGKSHIKSKILLSLGGTHKSPRGSSLRTHRSLLRKLGVQRPMHPLQPHLSISSSPQPHPHKLGGTRRHSGSCSRGLELSNLSRVCVVVHTSLDHYKLSRTTNTQKCLVVVSFSSH